MAIIFNFIRLLTYSIDKSYGGYTIGRDLWMVLRGRLKSEASRYDVVDRVYENKSGLWTYNGHQGLSYSISVAF